MPDFRRSAGGVQIKLDAAETEMLRNLCGQLRALLTGTTTAPDPVLERLFPAAHEDPAIAEQYRELIGNELERHKLSALDAVSTALGERSTKVILTDETFDLWLACLTDLRLAIGTRLDIDEARMAAEVDPNDPDAQPLAVLHWLGYVQENLLQAAGA